MSVAGIAPRPARATRPVRAEPPVVMSAPLLLLFLLQSTLASSHLHSVTAVAGGAVSLDCPLDLAPHTACHWTKDGFVLSTEQAGYSRHSTTGENCQLVIEPVLAVDRGEYGCQVPGSRSPPLTLTVHTPPSRPTILQSASQGRDWLRLPPGNPVVLDCEAGGASPAGEIHWWDANTGERITADVVETVTRERGGHAFTTTSKLSFIPKNDLLINCSVQSDSFQQPKYSKSLQLELLGRLKVMEVVEGDGFTLHCHGGEEADYSWFINDKELHGEKAASLIITEFVPAFDNAVIRCRVDGVTIKQVQLIRTEDENDPTDAPPPTAKIPPNLRDPLAFHPQRTVFTCYSEEEEQFPPPAVVSLQAGRAEDELNRKYSCKKMLKGYNRLRQMSQQFNSFNMKIKRLKKKLKKFH